ncbi:MAG: rod shape-determining protein [Blastocatellia bacterium]
MQRSITAGLRKLVAPPDLAIDLGTANTRLYALGHGLIANEPSLIRLQPFTGEVEAVGKQAAWLAKVDPYSPTVSPLHAGVIADLEAATSLLIPFLKRAQGFGMFKPRVLACAPTDACEEERAVLIEAAMRAGASEVFIAPEPLAAAIGAGMDVASNYAQMIVDIGDGVTDIAVVRSGNLILASGVRTACSDLRSAVAEMVSFRHGVLLFPQEAERLMQLIGAQFDYEQEQLVVTSGTDLLTGDQIDLCVSRHDLNEAIEPVLDTIVEAINTAVRRLPEDTSCEVIENGICLTGGGAMLQGLPERLAAATSLEVRVADDPMMAVINGARQMLDVGIATEIWQN